MANSKKTDNHNPKVKLDLRRYFLDKYHKQHQPRVFDCCQGSGVLWSQLKQEYQLGSYWGVDLKPKAGRLKVDSSRILEQAGWSYDVIDVDAYGSPWKHWSHILRNATDDVTVFLTVGMVRIAGGGNLDQTQKNILGISSPNVPPGIQGKLHELSAKYLLALTGVHCTISEVKEAFPSNNARYIGVRLEKRTGSDASTSKPVLSTTF